MTSKTMDYEGIETQKQYPALAELPEKAREILILTAIGYTQDMIAQRLGCTQPAISQAIQKFDPDGIYKPDMDLRKEVIKTALGNVTLECIRMLNKKTGELAEYTPKTLLDLLKKLTEVSDALGDKASTGEGVRGALDSLRSS